MKEETEPDREHRHVTDTAAELSTLSYLWDGSEPDWVVLAQDDSLDHAMPYNLRTRMMLVIEDDQLLTLAICRMRECAVRRARIEDGQVTIVGDAAVNNSDNEA